MPSRDWADVEAENLVWANSKTLATTRKQVAAALRAAEARGYKRGCEEFLQRLVDSAHEEARPLWRQDEKEQT